MEDIIKLAGQRLENKLPFVVYCKPGSSYIKAIFPKGDVVSGRANFKEKGFAFAPFFNGNTIFLPADDAEVMVTGRSEAISAAMPSAAPQPAQADAGAKASFKTLVNKSVEAIKSGQFQKLVVSRKETVPIVNRDARAIYLRLLGAYPNAFCYCFYSPETGLWMGATPEQLLKADGDSLQTVALAGTQVYNEGITATWQEKEKQEQAFVTGYILKALAGHAIDIKASEPYTFRAGGVVHIRTDISARPASGSSVGGILDALHPTPAVCGLPKQQAKEFLLENEGYEREYYSGYLGEVNMDAASGEGHTDLFVNLRCMKIEAGKAHIYVGCGITKDSDPEKEFVETENKALTMRRVL